jgi:hypothetical protein
MFSSDVKPRFLKPGKCHIMQICDFIFYMGVKRHLLPFPLHMFENKVLASAFYLRDTKQQYNESYIMRNFVVDTLT